MEIKAIEERIAKAQAKHDKLLVKLGRIQAALTGGKNPYYYDESDLRRCVGEIQRTQENIDALKFKLQQEHKNDIRIPIIEEFLDQWVAKARIFHTAERVRIAEFRAEVKLKRELAKQECASLGIPDWGRKSDPIFTKYRIERSQIEQQESTMFSRAGRDIFHATNWSQVLEETLLKEKNAKRKLLVQRVKAEVGNITDASYLRIGDNGEINGIITGDKGKAKVNTIYAGGHNIQCLHFRVLVKQVK